MSMEVKDLTELIKTYIPSHLCDMCAILAFLVDEMENAKATLTADLFNAQSQNDFSKARVTLDTLEELSKRISDVRKTFAELDIEEEQEEFEDVVLDDGGSTESGEQVDYSQYDMNASVAYDIEDTPVTFKRPVAFSFNGKQYKVTTWKTMLTKLCELLYKKNPEILKSMVGEERQPGYRRVKMSTNKIGFHSPVMIPGSNIWIETNRSASDLRGYILALLNRYGIPVESVKIYF